jgi:hypothetical protein
MAKPVNTRRCLAVRLFFSLLLLAALLAALGTGVAGWVGYLSAAPMKFDAKKWRAGDPRHRYRMYHDLLDSGILEGKTRAEVIELLGPGGTGRDDQLAYAMTDPSFGLFGWDETLFIEFSGYLTHTRVED